MVHDGKNQDSIRLVAELFGPVYIRETGKGVVDANKAALRESRDDIVAFTDDIVVPELKWLEELEGMYSKGMEAVRGAVKKMSSAQHSLVTTRIGKTREFTGWQIVTDFLKVDEHVRRYQPKKTGNLRPCGRTRQKLKIPNMHAVEKPLILDYLSWAKKKVLIVSIPFAYPAPKVNGIFAGGRFIPKSSFYRGKVASKCDLSGFDYQSREIKSNANDVTERSRYAQSILEAFEKRIKKSTEISKAKS